MGWNEWKEAIDAAVNLKTQAGEAGRVEKKKPKPKKRSAKQMTGMEYMMKINREGRGHI